MKKDHLTAFDHPTVLDIGFGNGTLTKKLCDGGCKIRGQDFSEKMLEAARGKMPDVCRDAAGESWDATNAILYSTSLRESFRRFGSSGSRSAPGCCI